MEELDEKLDAVKAQLAAAQHSAVGTQTQLAHAHEAAVASGRTMLDLQTELSAVNVVNDDIKSQLEKALAAKAALSGSVMHVCAQRETQNPYFSTVLSWQRKERTQEGCHMPPPPLIKVLKMSVMTDSTENAAHPKSTELKTQIPLYLVVQNPIEDLVLFQFVPRNPGFPKKLKGLCGCSIFSGISAPPTSTQMTNSDSSVSESPQGTLGIQSFQFNSIFSETYHRCNHWC